MTATTSTLPPFLADLQFLPSMSLGEYLSYCALHHPALYERIDLECWSPADVARLSTTFTSTSTHFKSDGSGSRGDTYRAAQRRNAVSRADGIRRVFELVTPAGEVLSPSTCVLDVLGGNGALTRVMRQIEQPHRVPTIVTSDQTAEMVVDALELGLPAIRQPAQQLLLRDETFDGVILAYGTHHIPPEDRLPALKEARRVLRQDGRVVVQDFEPETLTARWYSEVLHTYTASGHDFRHLGQQEMISLLTEAGFRDVEVVAVYDPFVFYDDTADRVLRALLRHVCSLFGLVKLKSQDDESEHTWSEVESVFRKYSSFGDHEWFPFPDGVPRELSIKREGGRFRAELPRVAVAATGTR
jgi:ubiquinone/menaquinone biosynthesis C-methylase UbiE